MNFVGYIERDSTIWSKEYGKDLLQDGLQLKGGITNCGPYANTFVVGHVM
jgi:hypothetical protein